jgi:integrase
MFNWAVAREYLDHTPFKRGNQNRIPMELEDNHRHRRLGEQEEKALLAAATGPLRTLMIAALDTGMRRGEMLALTWGNVDARPGWLRLRGETTKSSRTRWVPVSTARLKAVLDFLRPTRRARRSRAMPRCSVTSSANRSAISSGAGAAPARGPTLPISIEMPGNGREADDNSLTPLDKGSGVDDGVRTRDFRSHSPALYH